MPCIERCRPIDRQRFTGRIANFCDECRRRGAEAIVAQHECDHLDGVLYVDKADRSTMTFLEEYRRFGPWPLEKDARADEIAGDEADE